MKDNNIKVHQAKQDSHNALAAAAKHHTKNKSFKKWFVADKKTSSSQDDTDPTFIHYILRCFADAVSTVIRIIYGAWQGAYNALFNNGAHTNSHGSAKPAPAPTESVAESAPAANTATGLIQSMESTFAGIESIKMLFVASYNNACRSIKALASVIAHYPEISSNITALPQILVATEAATPAWKKTALSWFSDTIDGTVHAFEWTKKTTTRIYRSYIQPTLAKITRDVSAKLIQKKEVTEKAKPEAETTTPELPQVPTRAA